MKLFELTEKLAWNSEPVMTPEVTARVTATKMSSFCFVGGELSLAPPVTYKLAFWVYFRLSTAA